MSKAVGRGGHKKVKKEKKEVPLKTAEERKLEVDYIKGVLLQYQIDDSCAPIAELFAIMRQFVETEPVRYFVPIGVITSKVFTLAFGVRYLVQRGKPSEVKLIFLNARLMDVLSNINSFKRRCTNQHVI